MVQPLPLPQSRTWRAVLPIALLLAGGAANCWQACTSWTPETAADQIARLRRAMEADLRKLLPPPASKSTRSADRLQITGDHPAGELFAAMHVVAVGNFSAESARDFAAVARQPRPESFARIITVAIYNDTNGARTLVARYGTNRSRAFADYLWAHMPAPAPDARGESFHVAVFPGIEGLVDSYSLNLTGPFTAETAAIMVATVRELHRATAPETHITGRVSSTATRPYTKLENFDLAPTK